jgi:hypothetical protein
VFFDVEMNNLEGEIPSGLYQITGLQKLLLGGNSKLYGKFGSEFGNFTSLKELSLGPSQFTGTLPSFLFNFVELVELNLSGAAFSGTLSEAFSSLERLQTLFLNNNTFTGTIPVAFESLTNLSKLSSVEQRFDSKNDTKHSWFAHVQGNCCSMAMK